MEKDRISVWKKRLALLVLLICLSLFPVSASAEEHEAEEHEDTIIAETLPTSDAAESEDILGQDDAVIEKELEADPENQPDEEHENDETTENANSHDLPSDDSGDRNPQEITGEEETQKDLIQESNEDIQPSTETVIIEEEQEDDSLVVEETYGSETEEISELDDTIDEESIDVSDCVLQAGGLLPDNSQLLRTTRGDPNTAAKSTIYDGLCAWKNEITVEEYNLSFNSIRTIFSEVLNEHPDLFYVSSGFSSHSGASGVISITPRYDDSYTDADVAAYRNTVQQIVGMVEPAWSDVEKLLFLHDYLVTHCEYDLSYQRYNAHDALVVRTAVCQGYSLAFRDLCQKSGIDATIVSSRAINHAWNLVSLGGENFFIDCTWDDPSNNWYEGRCCHSNFLLSRAALSENHNGTDWTDGKMNVYESESSSRYDNAWWRDVNTAVPLIGHIAAYSTDNDLSSVYLRNMSTDSVTLVPFPDSARWPVWGNSYSYWNGNFSSVAALNGLFYFTLPTNIWSLSPAGVTKLVYQLTEAELSQGYIYGIVNDGGTLFYNIGTQGYNTSFQRAALPGNTAKNQWVKINGNWYYYDASGQILKNGWAKDSGGWCWLGSDGKQVENRWISTGGAWYYINGSGHRIENGWAKDSGGWCWLGSDGKQVENRWISTGGAWYYINGSGRRIENGWAKDSGGWCWLGSDGKQVENRWISTGGAWYYINGSGHRIENGWAKDSGGWCWLGTDGKQVENRWIKSSGAWYYIDGNGHRIENGWAKDSGGWCWLGADGKQVESTWITTNGKKYYVDANGHRVTGTQTINGKKYTFDSDGALIT